MKRLYLLLLVTLLTSHLRAQQFEGYVEYIHNLSLPDKSMDLKKTWPLFGTSSVYFYRSGEYRWSFNNSEVTDEYYDPASNIVTVYYKIQPPESAPASDPCKIIKDSLLTEQSTVAGITCKKYYIEIQLPRGIMKRTFYYSEAYQLNPADFANFTSNAMNHVYAQIKAIPLRIDVVTEEGIKIVYQAKKVVRQKIENKLLIAR